MNSLEKKYGRWIVTYPRSGSTYLCTILNNNFCTQFSEKIRSLIREKKEINLSEIKDEKVHAFDFRKLKTELPESNKYLFLKRDIIDQVVSFYVAKKTNIWNVCIESFEEKINEKELLIYYNFYKRYQKFWNKKLKQKNFIEVNYDDLYKETGKELDKIADFWELKKTNYNLKLDLNKNKINYEPIKVILKSLISSDFSKKVK